MRVSVLAPSAPGPKRRRRWARPLPAPRRCRQRSAGLGMNDLVLVRKNLFRKKLRAGLMVIAILIAFAIFGVLAGFYSAFNWRQEQAAADHLVVANKINFTLPLPFAYYNRVRAIEGVRQVTYASWFGGYYQDPRNVVAAMAVDPETYFDIYASWFELSEPVRREFLKERTGAVVGEDLALKRGWKVGDHIPLSSHIFSRRNGSNTWDFTIVGLFRARTAGISTNSMMFHYAYLDETRSLQKNTIGWMVLQTTSQPSTIAWGRPSSRCLPIPPTGRPGPGERSFAAPSWR